MVPQLPFHFTPKKLIFQWVLNDRYDAETRTLDLSYFSLDRGYFFIYVLSNFRTQIFT